MTIIEVKYGTVTDALGCKRTGWFVIENGNPGVPFETKEEAEKQAAATREIRRASR